MKILLCLGVVLLCGCAKTYYLTAHDGRKIEFESYALGDTEYYYSCELYETGKLSSEKYGFKRKISPVMEAGASLAEAALAGAKQGL